MKWLGNKKQILKSYSFWSMFSNFLVALSISGLSVLGILSAEIALPALITIALALGLFGLVGRFMDQELDDRKEDD